MPHASRAAAEVLSLPVHPRLTAHDLEIIVDATRAALG
jgi:dTDP-4-amino-4,6-dideoxygalactose transaminase